MKVTHGLIYSLSFLWFILLHVEIVSCSHLDEPGCFDHRYTKLAQVREYLLFLVKCWHFSTQLTQWFGSRCKIFEPTFHVWSFLSGDLEMWRGNDILTKHKKSNIKICKENNQSLINTAYGNKEI